MSEISAEQIREVISNPDPVLEALSLMLRELAGETVDALATVLSMLGTNPTQLPGEYLLQAVLVEADKVFAPVSRENWIKIYDSYKEVQRVIEANPELKSELNKSFGKAAETSAAKEDPFEALLDGKF
jgi:hypothetical protein